MKWITDWVCPRQDRFENGSELSDIDIVLLALGGVVLVLLVLVLIVMAWSTMS